MENVQLQFLGSGDAFGSGGRLQSCLLVNAGELCFLVDCGATAVIAMRRYGVDPNGVRTVVLTHLHGDHFAGIPFLVLDAQLVSRRTGPLTVAGPKGTAQRVTDLMEVMFPGSSKVSRKFDLEFVEIEAKGSRTVNGIAITAETAVHPSGADSLMLRIGAAGKTIACTGDTEWTDGLISIAQNADVLIAEGYTFDKKVKFHLDYATIMEKKAALRAKRIVLNHRGADMVTRDAPAGVEFADDGMVIEL